ncbi:MAG: HEAT repeat domain-containing protein [Planctomycetes bacterium]|nr:HEAT repeat domain-containing protein [Planctomycetota bacterium]
MILSALLWCLGFQDASWPELPPKLSEDEAVREQYLAGLQNGGPDERRSAAESIFTALESADPAAAADFLLGLAAQDDLLETVDFQPVLLRHHLRWNAFSARIEEVLVAGRSVTDTPHQKALVMGSLRAAGLLELGASSRVESVAAYLGRNGYDPEARKALKRITLREFRDRAQFASWWEIARDQSRLDWVLSQADAATLEVVGLWRDLIAANPAKALDALQHERVEVRMIALTQLSGLPVDAVDSKDQAASTVVYAALIGEVDPRLRVELTRMVPSLFPEGRQVEVLKSMLGDAELSTAVRIAAAESLLRAKPVDEVTMALVEELETAYALDVEGWGPLPVRVKLISGFFQHVNGNRTVAASLFTGDLAANNAAVTAPTASALERVERAMSAGIAYESAAEVRVALFRLMGELGSTSQLLGLVFGSASREDLPTEVRQAAIEAFGAVLGRVGVDDSGLNRLGSLLGNENLDVRFAAAGALGSTGDDHAFVMLAERLKSEAEAAMINRLLKQLRKGKVPATVQSLLAFTPTDKQRSLYRDVLDKAINGDDQLRLQAMDVLLARSDFELAWRLDAGLQALPPDAPADWGRIAMRTRAQAGWALTNPIPPAADNPSLPGILARLSDLQTAEPEDLGWPRMQAELRLRIGQDAEGFSLLETLLPRMDTGADLDRLALAAFQAAERAQLAERAVSLAASLKPMSTPEVEKAMGEVLARLKVTSDPQDASLSAEGDAENFQPSEVLTERPAEVLEPGQPVPEDPSSEPAGPVGNGGGVGGGTEQPEAPAQPVKGGGDGSEGGN